MPTNLRWAKRFVFPEDENPENMQQPNEIALADQDGLPLVARLQVRVTETDWEDIPVVWDFE